MKCYRCTSWPCECVDGQTILHGDCLDLLPMCRAESVITDPPYMIGSHSTGTEASKTGGWADQMNSAHFYHQWLAMAKKSLAGAGYIAVFGNWRSVPTYAKAFSMAGVPMTSCVVWDKEWIGPAYENAFRPTWELIAISAVGEVRIDNRSTSDIIRCKWMSSQSGTTGHKAEKPVDLLQYLILHLSLPGSRVLDPFLGSGTTLVAAKNTGRKGVGIEAEERYCEIAANRLRQNVLQFTD